MAGGALSSAAGKSTADVALQLEALLGQHSVLGSDMMRSRIRDDEDVAQVASAAVTRNTDDLAAAMGTLFGPAAGQRFLALWADHVDALVGYTAGAHALAYDAYQDRFGLARQLSDAFGETVAARLPQGGAETGAGGTAGVPGPR